MMFLKIRTETPSRLEIVFALAAVYLLWGSTYLALRVALEGFPPFLMAGIRFVTAGSILFAILHLKGEPIPKNVQSIKSCCHYAGEHQVALAMRQSNNLC